MNKQHIIKIFHKFNEDNPNPRTELHYTSAYELLIAVILSAQATDKSVNLVTPQLFSVANTPEKMVELGIDRLKEHIKSIGLFNNKAKHIIACSSMLINDFASQVPLNLPDLMLLPGVGRKTANVMLNTLCLAPTIAVDTHVFRVSNRLGLVQGTTPLEVECQLNAVVPDQYKPKAHHWLVLHGRYICKAKKPLCDSCLVEDLCEYSKKTSS